MAGIEVIASVSDLSSGVAFKTLLQIATPANHRAKVKGWGVFCKGIVTTDAPLLVQLLRQTTAGTMSANTPTKKDPSVAETLQVTALENASAEPTESAILKSIDVHPQSSFSEYFPLGSEIPLPGSSRLGIRVLAGVSVSISAFLDYEE